MMKMKRRYGYVMTVVLAGLLFGGCGVQDKVISLPVLEQGEEMAQDVEAAGTDGTLPDETEQMIYVHVCGAVINPGVVQLPEGSRREDAVLAAGGFAENAGENYVNLAALLTDGEQLYVPDVEEGRLLKQALMQGGSAVVNINTATQEVLCTLPGIGSSRAKDIIAYREKHGKFMRKEDIMQVSGIKESIFQRICEQIVVE